MDSEIELVRDDDGIALFGESQAVEKLLRSEGLWSVSRALDLRPLKSILATGADVAQAGSEIAANSGRWIKLTEESARLVRDNGLMESGTPGTSHLMIGIPGSIKSWLQAETGPGTLVTNPAVLSGVSGMMAQAARQQAMAEVTAYLVRIDEKVDDILAKVDNTVLKDMRGARTQIRRAHTMREREGRLSDDSWSEVQNASGKIADVQGYALQELERISAKLESKSRMSGLAETTEQIKPQVQSWLAVLADCFQLQEAFDVLVLDRALDESPEVLDSRRRGLEADRQDRLVSISQHTEHLLGRMDAAVDKANVRMIWTRENSLAVVESGKRLEAGVRDFHSIVGISSDPRSWEAKSLGIIGELSAHAIQGTKDVAPYGAAAIAVGTVFVKKVIQKK